MPQTLLMQSLAEQLLLEDTTPEDIEQILALIEDPALVALTHPPVDFVTFVESPYFLNSPNILYPEVLRAGCELNNGTYEEAVLTGGIGTGKTTLALFSTAYQLYKLSCYVNPQSTFGLDPSSEIVFIFQSLNAKLAKAVDYDRFKDMIGKSPYFKQQFEYDKTLLSELRFPNRIIVKPISGNETGAIGQNVIGGIIDEINFMAVIGSSKQSPGGGTYDQAIELYNAISRRRKSRFLAGGRMPGLLCLVSSKRTPGQFTDRKEEEAKTNPRIFVYDKRVWDVKPDNFTGVVFSVFIGDQTRKPRILETEDTVAHEDRHLIDRIPVEFKQEFQDDITKALRDIAGRSTNAIHPFMADTERVTQGFGKVQSVLTVNECDFIGVRPGILQSRILNRQYPRFVHLDLSLTGDSTGVVIGHCPMFKKIQRVETEEILPVIQIDCVLEVKAPKGGEIEYHKIRHLLYKLRELGLPIRWVTLDSYQSADTMQVLRTEGFQTGYQSLDTTMVPYVVLKAALYDGRVLMPVHEKLKVELTTLERDFKRGKIDHSAHGCAFGTVKVHCIDGMSRSFEELTADYAQGVQHMGLTWDSAINCARPALLEKPHITKYVQELVEIEFDTGLSVKFTPNHLFLLEDGSYVEAQYLTSEHQLRY